VITGAAGGFGRALALELAGRQAQLVLSDVDVKGVAETAALAMAAGATSARATRCDVTKIDDWTALAASCEGPVDLVVNNAGVSSAGLVGNLPLEDWRWTLEVDLFGVIHGCHTFVPMLRKQGHGHVLNVASSAGLLAAPYMGAYNVAKAGVIALSETLKGELYGTKIGVTVICPTFFKTNIVNSGRIADERLKEKAQSFVSAGRTAESVARDAIAAVDRGAFYSVPMADGRWLWRVKRVAPGAFTALVGRVGKRAIESPTR
jgi:NAD(P)-dependent dehydrogenase (short-subunit alcohol dehydrogenase family)